MEDRIHTLLMSSAALPYATDAPVREDLKVLGYSDLRSFIIEGTTVRSVRTRMRYLAALFPHLSFVELSNAIHAVLGNKSLTLSDVRLVLEGRRLNDPSKRTGEVPVEAIQKVGDVLATGGSRLAAARAAGVSVDTVNAIDDYLEISQRYDDNLMDIAVTGVRSGWSVRELAKVAKMSKSTAHRYLGRARLVLAEIGEAV
jgi:AraC-like DNA-binding protein